MTDREYSEIKITEKIMIYLNNIAGTPESFSKKGNEIKFDFFVGKRKHICQTERMLSYKLPNGYFMTHKADIAITRNEGHEQYYLNPSNKFVSIEIKHKSAVTDSFKSRAYDMIHLRKQYPQCYGIMIYIRGKSITVDTAKQYCYPYQEFFGCMTNELTEEKIKPLFNKIISFLRE